MTNQQPIDWEAYRAGKKTGLAIGYAEGLKVGIAVLAEMRFGPPDALFLEEIRDISEPGILEWMLRRLATATSLREVRALGPPPDELDTTAAPQPH
jgi:hypothetical protein